MMVGEAPQMIELLVGAAVAAGTYLYAKRKKASTGQSVAAAAVTGAGGVAATAATLWMIAAVWPVLVVGALAGGYYFGKRKQPKALPPGSSI
jgi:hypothetical protein